MEALNIMKNEKIIVAIDGFSSTGKSTFARLIAQKISYIYIDTGAMYRAVTLFCLENSFIHNCVLNVNKIIENLEHINVMFAFNSQTSRNEILLNGRKVDNIIRELDVSNNVSAVSAIPEVRKQMVALQQKMGENKGTVMDGRDIGTVVFPNAELKIFMTAKPETRAKRRYAELLQNGINATFAEVEQNIIQRDYLDSHRDASPLKKANDAIILDNSNMSIDEQMLWFDKIFHETIEKIKNGSRN